MTASAVGVLARIRHGVPAGGPQRAPRCELCGAAAGDEHRHVVDVSAGRMLCACPACALLFERAGAGGGRFRTVPDRWARVGTAASAARLLEALDVPVGVAFVVRRSGLGRPVVFYPGPAGVTESSLPLAAWGEVCGAHPDLQELEADVEALLVRAVPEGGAEAYRVPVDACYGLAGRLRACWRGFDGGADARRELSDFFAAVRRRAR